MKRFTDILRHTLNTMFFLLVLSAIGIYGLVHFELLGKIVQETVEPMLAEKLQTKVEIGEMEITWLNQLAINDVVIYDQEEDTLLYARRAMVSYELLPLITQKLIINTVQLIEFDLRLKQASPESDPNFKFVIDALAPKQQNKRKIINDLSLHALNLRRGKLSYQLGEKPMKSLPYPDYRDIQMTDITAALQLELSHITGLDINVKRFSLKENGGLLLEGNGQMHDDSIHLVCNRLLLDCQLPARLDLGFVADMSLNNPMEVTYSSEIREAEVSSKTLQRLQKIHGFELPESARPWTDSLKLVRLEGQCTGKGISLINFTGHEKSEGRIGTDFDLRVDYDTTQVKPLNAQAKGRIHRLPFHGHTYRDIEVDVRSNGEDATFDFFSHDPYCRMSGEGEVKLQDKRTQITFSSGIRHFNPHALHLSSWENLEGLSLIAQVQGKLDLVKGAWPLGELSIEEIALQSAADTIYLDPINVNLAEEDHAWVGVVTAPFINCVGTKTAAIAYFPTNEALAKMLNLPGWLTKDASLVAEWDSTTLDLHLEGNIPEISTADGTINAHFSAQGKSEPHSPMPQLLQGNLAFDYITPKHMLSAAVVTNVQPQPLLIELENAEITVDGHPFSTEGATLSQASNGVFTLAGLEFRNGEEELSINGYYHNEKDMQAQLYANDLKIDFFLDMLGKGYLDFGGRATGNVTLNSDSVLHLETEELFIKDFSYIEQMLGDNTLSAYYDLENRNLYVDAHLNNDGNMSHASCEVRIGAPNVKAFVDLDVESNKLPIDFVDYWLGGVVKDIHGVGSGHVRLFGDTDHLNLIGHPVIDANFTHDLVGARFYLRDTVHLEATGDSLEMGLVALRKAKFYDRDGQQAVVDLDVSHNYLSHFNYNVDINIPQSTNGFLLFDYPQQRNSDLYWGQLWGYGRCQMHGSTTTNRHRIGLQMEPAGRSILYLSPGEANFSDNAYSFLSFRDKSTLIYNGDEWEMLSRVRTNKKEVNNSTYIEADLQVHANDHCLVNMLMDPLAEDRLLCRGEGDIALHYDSNHDLNITGNYDIKNGSYTITMRGDLMSKSFQLQNGSRVSFSGVPSEADLNLKAIYSIPAANLKDLDESFATASNLSRTTVPVDCKLNVNGQLTAPQISFDLEVKNVSDDVQALVHNIIGTPEMLNREVFYLLLLGRFYTPEYASTSNNNTGGGLSSFASSALSSQLNNLLGHMSDNFSLGTSFHSEKGDFSDMEMDLTMQTRLFSDRLLLSGNLSYRDPANRVGMASSSSSFIGDFDVEYLINPSGTLRAKAYSHYNERYYNINNSLTTQGIGIVTRKDFNSFKELLPWHSKKAK